MAQVFLSYDREDAPRARSIATALEKAGHSVWWDRHIKGGAQYSKEIEQALKAADAVVVLWSEQSVESPWVRDEAAAGRDNGRLVPVRLDQIEPPLGFRQYQTIDLSRGRLGSAGREALLGAVAQVAGSAAAPTMKTSRRSLPTPPLWLIAGLGFAVIVAALLLWRPWDSQRGGIIVAVAAKGNDRASQDLARDLTIRLVSLQAASSGAIRLVEAADMAQSPDLLFEAATAAETPANASLVLKSARDSSILWSRDFEQPTGRRADLLQQVAYTAARVIGCALEGLNDSPRLEQAVLKTYLNACAQLAETASADPRPPITLLREVVKASPRFKPGWSKLLLAEAVSVSPEFTAAETDDRGIAELRRHIAEARQVDPAMPEAALAEAMLLPPRDFTGRTARIEEAAARSPDNPAVLSQLAGALSETGRTREAIEAASRAARLDPLSPSIHGDFTALLAYGGNFAAAKRELEKAEKLWPGTASLQDAQYRFHLRYGDPRMARAIFEQQTDGGGQAPRLYLDARQNPTPTNIERLLTYVRARLKNMENPSAGIGFATLAFGRFGKTEEVFSALLAWPRADDVAIISEVLFRPEFRDVRRDPRFLLIAQRTGLLDYWLKSGKWPDFCFDSDKAYDCKAEAAKLG